MQDHRIEFTRKIEVAKEELEDYRQDAESATGQFKARYAARFASAVQRFIEEISTGYSQREAAYSKMLERLMELDGKIRKMKEEIDCGKKNSLSWRLRETKLKTRSKNMMPSTKL